MTIIRRRTYTAGTVELKYGYYMNNSVGSNSYEDLIYYDQDGNYYNPVFKKYGAEERTGYFPLANMDHTISKEHRVNGNYVDTYDILQVSYTDGQYIACLNGTLMWWSSNGGSSWSNLFTLGYGRTGAYHIMDAVFVYFDSTYVYVLFEVSSAATMTAYSSVSLILAYYPRAGGSVSYRAITSYSDHYLFNSYGISTRMSPNGVVCCVFAYKKASGSSYYATPFPQDPVANKCTCALMYIPGLVTSDNSYKSFDISLDNTGLNTSNTASIGLVSTSPKWHWDSGYGYFLLPMITGYYTASGSASDRKIFKIPISVSGTTLSTPTVTSVFSEHPSVWNTDYILLTEHALGIVSDETLVIEPSKTVKIKKVSDWSTKIELPTMSDILALQDITLSNYGGTIYYLSINITPDGLYYVVFTNPGATIFINRRNGKILKNTKFLGTGNMLNTVYHHYMMPKRVL